MLKKSLEYTLVGFEVPMPLSGCNGVGFKKQKKVYVSDPFLKNHTNRRKSIGCHLRSGDVTLKFVVAVVGVSYSLGDRDTGAQDVLPIYRTHR